MCLLRQNLLWRNYVCHNQILLLWQNFYCNKYLSRQTCFLQQKFCGDKHAFFVTQDVFCHDKHVFVVKKVSLSPQKFCHDNYICRDKSFVVTKICLSWQAYFGRNKRCVLLQQTRVCHTKTFVTTKMILVAAHTNDTFFGLVLRFIVLCCIVFHFILLCCIVFYCIVLCCIVIGLHCNWVALYCVTFYCISLTLYCGCSWQMGLMGSRPAEQRPVPHWASCLTTAWIAGPPSSCLWGSTPSSGAGSTGCACSGSTFWWWASCSASSCRTGRSTTLASSFCPGATTLGRLWVGALWHVQCKINAKCLFWSSEIVTLLLVVGAGNREFMQCFQRLFVSLLILNIGSLWRGFQQLRALCDIIFYCGMYKCFMQREKNQWHSNTLLSIPIHIKHKATFRVRMVFEGLWKFWKNGIRFSSPWKSVKTEWGLWKVVNFVVFTVLGKNYQLISQKLHFPRPNSS